MPARTYRIRIDRDDLHFEVEGDKAFVLQMLKRLQGGGAPPAAMELGKPSKGEPGAPTKAIPLGKGVSVGEFIRQFNFKKHTDLVLAFGYYLEQHSGLKDFTAADINNCYYEAKMEKSNTSQMFINNIRRGFMMAAKGQKAGKRRYTLTRTGEDHLKAALTKTKKS